LIFDSAFLDEEDIVAKLHFLEQMEARWPYAPAKGLALAERVRQSLAQLPDEYRRFALAAFANVIYLPDALLRESWSYLATEVARARGLTSADLIEQSHLLEVDPSGLIPSFLHENKIHGRLDTDRFSRLKSVDEVASTLKLIALSEQSEEGAIQQIRLAFSKRYWLVLSDNVLSATSISSDLARCTRLIEAYADLGRPEIVPMVQVLTSEAERILGPHWHPYFAVRLDDRARIVPDNKMCSLVNSSATLEGIVGLSNWLADQQWFARDDRMLRTIEKSGDRMAHGFKNGGWTIVTPNCPTNSLPILWYECQGHYEGPFPRIMSRTTQSPGTGEEVTRIAAENAVKVLRRLGVK